LLADRRAFARAESVSLTVEEVRGTLGRTLQISTKG
jgi:hypothetical protein